MMYETSYKKVRLMKKKIALVALSLLSVAAMQADSYSHLTFQRKDGSCLSFPVASLAMVVSGEKLLVYGGGKNGELGLSDLSCMYFSTADVTGIQDVEKKAGVLEVYSLQGVKYGCFESMEEMRSCVPAGVYVIRQQGKTQKIIIR